MAPTTEPAVKPSLRAKHTTETRARIITVARDLFIANGFNATTVDQIAEAADVSPRTFFRYFPTKESLLYHDFDERIADIRSLIEARPPHETPLEALVNVMCEVVDDSSRADHELMVCLSKEDPSPLNAERAVFEAQAMREVTAAMATRSGASPDDLELRAVVAAISGCFEVAKRDWVEGGSQDDFGRRLRATVDACTAAFRPT